MRDESDPEVSQLRDKIAILEASLEVEKKYTTIFREALASILMMAPDSEQGKKAAEVLGL